MKRNIIIWTYAKYYEKLCRIIEIYNHKINDYNIEIVQKEMVEIVSELKKSTYSVKPSLILLENEKILEIVNQLPNVFLI